MATTKMLLVLLLAQCASSLLVAAEANSFVYPRNMYELNFIEETTSVKRGRNVESADSAADVLDYLRAQKVKRFLDGKEEDNLDEATKRQEEHLTELLNTYIDVSYVSVDKCNELYISQLVFLINFHAGHENSKVLLNYLKHFTWKQLYLCKPQWDKNLEQVVATGLSDETKSQVNQLLDQMMQVRLGKVRPYQRHELDLVSRRPTAGGLLLFLALVGDLEDDKRDYQWDEFLAAVDRKLMPTCREVCTKVRPALTPYSLLNDRALFDPLNEKLMFGADQNDLWLWAANTKICCRLVRARDQPGQVVPNLLRQAYDELTEPELPVEEWDKEREEFIKAGGFVSKLLEMEE